MVVLLSEYIFIKKSLPYHSSFLSHLHYPTSIYQFKLNNRNTRTTREICSKLTVKTPGQRQLFTLNNFHILFWCPIVDFEQANLMQFCNIFILLACFPQETQLECPVLLDLGHGTIRHRHEERVGLSETEEGSKVKIGYFYHPRLNDFSEGKTLPFQ